MAGVKGHVLIEVETGQPLDEFCGLGCGLKYEMVPVGSDNLLIRRPRG